MRGDVRPALHASGESLILRRGATAGNARHATRVRIMGPSASVFAALGRSCHPPPFRHSLVTRRLITSVALAASAAAVALRAAPAHAQLPGVPGVNPFSFGVEAGPAFPVGNFGNTASTGFTADALVEARLPVLPVGLRFEGGYASFGSKNGFESAHIVSGSANVVLRLSTVALSLVRPYVIGGIGIYGQNRGEGTHAGVNIGGGVSVPLVAVTAFADARYTSVFSSGIRTNFIPVRVGVRF